MESVINQVPGPTLLPVRTISAVTTMAVISTSRKYVEIGIWPVGFNATQYGNMNTNQHTFWGF